MARVLVNDESLTAIADAIREKLDVETTYLPSQMAGAIENIPSGSSLTSADEGKVVVESSGSYVLQAQTSRSISQNGTYDTTTNDEVVVNVSGGGGGGSINILDGTTEPTAQDGNDGALYIYHNYDAAIIQTNNLSDVSMSVIDGTLTITGTTSGDDSSDGGNSGILLYTSVNGVNIKVTAASSGVQYGTSNAQGTLPTIVTQGANRAQYNTSSSGANFTKTASQNYFAVAYSNGIGNTLKIELTPTSASEQFDSGDGLIQAIYLKVNGSWVDPIGQDINDVNLGN